MAMITLNKASRLQESLRRKLTTLPLKAETTLSIFSADLAAEIARRAGMLAADIDRTDRLLTILADVRASVGQANAESGIASLLAETGDRRHHAVPEDVEIHRDAQLPHRQVPDPHVDHAFRGLVTSDGLLTARARRSRST